MNGFIMAILSGISMGIGGLSYRCAANGGVQPIQLNALLGIFGAAVYALLGFDQWAELSAVPCIFGLIGGFTQYATIRLLREAMKRGPLAPAWCAISLGGFIPVIFFAFLVMDETPTTMQAVSVLCTCAAIAAAALGQDRGGSSGKSRGLRDRIEYAILLLMLLIFIGTLNILLKYSTTLPGTHDGCDLLQSQGNTMMTFVYVGMTVFSALDLTLNRAWRVNRYALIWGAVFIVGALLGTYFIIIAIPIAPSTTVFALSNTVSILSVAVGSTLFLHEKRSMSWYAMLVLSLAAIILNR